MRVLTVNAGSSSLKLRVVEADESVSLRFDLPGADVRDASRALAKALVEVGPLDAVAHRIVHGGEDFSGPVAIEGDVEARIEALSELAPLPQPKALWALREVRSRLPRLAHVACFDTAFHSSLPVWARTYALPGAWRSRYGLRRYGFHGLSYAYATSRVAELLGGSPEDRRLVICHLGAGASAAAVQGGRSVDTTMGFTPLEGLVMATRSGNVDPGILLWLVNEAGMDPRELAVALEHHSGLFGLAGSGDMREVLRRVEGGEAEAKVALDVYIGRLRGAIAAMAAAMGGLDALVFTGGVGENSPKVRELAAEGLGFLGVSLDQVSNYQGSGDREVGLAGAPVKALVVVAREELQMAREVRSVLAATPG